MYCYEAVHQQSRRDGQRGEGGGGYSAIARFMRGGGGGGGGGGHICASEYT